MIIQLQIPAPDRGSIRIVGCWKVFISLPISDFFSYVGTNLSMTEYTFSPILLAKAMDYKKVYLGDLNKIQNTFKLTFALNKQVSEIKKMSFLKS